MSAAVGPAGLEHAADAPTAHRMAFGLHFGAEAARAVALVVPAKRFAHGHLPGRLDRWCLLAALPRIIGRRGHA
ncbi:hypothetical protein [Hymenobacter sp. YC55]|uniref:hypothetical protein n=1 Tax=Hymenobacter sp. YC55 TaxID=3034019 RepID=UPI0023F8D0A7|nr:hypothetical protein [Hymenobacter sp. YC55]